MPFLTESIEDAVQPLSNDKKINIHTFQLEENFHSEKLKWSRSVNASFHLTDLYTVLALKNVNL